MEKSAFNKKFGSYVKHLRTNKGWTQSLLADKIEVDFQYISSLERGEFAPTVYWVYNLTFAFEIEFKDFMSGFQDYLNVKEK
jgi:transcriptional regulator with XRE-family HTH domain